MKGFSYRQALLIDQDLLVLSADFFNALSPGNESLARLNWQGLEQIELFQDKMRSVEDRIVSLSRYVRMSAPDESKVRLLEDLVKIGFSDAFDAEALLEVATQYRGLGQGKPLALLDSMERPLHHLGMHPTGAPFVVLALASLYATTSGKAFLQALPDDLDLEILNVLGRRAVRLGQEVSPLFPELFMEFSTNQVLSDPVKAFGPPTRIETFLGHQLLQSGASGIIYTS
ncbi:hypothetical protein [Nannocystis pusilla]|uniref:hypothetical protein n=1 Tax=Nannocystis pusilla TaxID=889268 RepID=UPI003B7F1EEA